MSNIDLKSIVDLKSMVDLKSLVNLKSKNPTDSFLIDMTMEHLVGDSNDSCIHDITGNSTKQIVFGELGAKVLSLRS